MFDDDELHGHWLDDQFYGPECLDDAGGPPHSNPYPLWPAEQKKAYWEKKNQEIALRVFCKPVKNYESQILQPRDDVSIWDSAFGRTKAPTSGISKRGYGGGVQVSSVVKQRCADSSTEKRLTLLQKFLATLGALVRRCGFLAESQKQTNTKERQPMNKTLLSLGLLAIAGGITQIANGIVDENNAAPAAPAPTPRKKKEEAAAVPTAPATPSAPAAPSAITSDAAKAELAKVSSTVNVDAAKAILRKLLPNEEKPKFSALTAEQYPALLALTVEALGTGAADEDEDPLG